MAAPSAVSWGVPGWCASSDTVSWRTFSIETRRTLCARAREWSTRHASLYQGGGTPPAAIDRQGLAGDHRLAAIGWRLSERVGNHAHRRGGGSVTAPHWWRCAHRAASVSASCTRFAWRRRRTVGRAEGARTHGAARAACGGTSRWARMAETRAQPRCTRISCAAATRSRVVETRARGAHGAERTAAAPLVVSKSSLWRSVRPHGAAAQWRRSGHPPRCASHACRATRAGNPTSALVRARVASRDPWPTLCEISCLQNPRSQDPIRAARTNQHQPVVTQPASSLNSRHAPWPPRRGSPLPTYVPPARTRPPHARRSPRTLRTRNCPLPFQRLRSNSRPSIASRVVAASADATPFRATHIHSHTPPAARVHLHLSATVFITRTPPSIAAPRQLTTRYIRARSRSRSRSRPAAREQESTQSSMTPQLPSQHSLPSRHSPPRTGAHKPIAYPRVPLRVPIHDNFQLSSPPHHTHQALHARCPLT